MVRKNPSMSWPERVARLQQLIARMEARLKYRTREQTDRTFFRRLDRYDSLEAMHERLHQQRRR